MDAVLLTIFAIVYLGMILGEIPGLALDRTGVALLGAIAVVATGRLDATEAWLAVDVPTIALLFGLMVVSAQFRLGGFYSAVTRRIAAAPVGPAALLAILVAVAGMLSAVLCNDIVCLAMAPILIEGCVRRRLDPKPFLLALACSSNVGSAATLIGNPQNMLIGQRLDLSFAGYLLDAGVPALLGLVATWGVIVAVTRGRWQGPGTALEAAAPAFDRWQTGKGLLVLATVLALFLAGPVPREVVAIAAAGVLLASRRMASREMLGQVDWQLLVLFVGLFVVNEALAASGLLAGLVTGLGQAGIPLDHAGVLFGATVILSNLVSNVPAVMLLLPATDHAQAGPILALASTLAGNLLVVGSIANVIVLDQARRLGVELGWRDHARVGPPVAVVTLGVAAAWLAL